MDNYESCFKANKHACAHTHTPLCKKPVNLFTDFSYSDYYLLENAFSTKFQHIASKIFKALGG